MAYELFKMDHESECGGVWQPYGSFMVLLARAGGSNKAFQKALSGLSKPFKRAIRLDMMDDEIQLGLVRQAFADTVILDWRVNVADTSDPLSGEQGLYDPEDEKRVLPFTRDNVLRVLKALPDLFDDIVEQAQNQSLYSLAARERAAGNS